MKYEKMQRGKTYIVTKSSSDGCIRKGQTIWLTDFPSANIRNALCVQDTLGSGWIAEKDLKSEKAHDFEVSEKPFFSLPPLSFSERS